MDDTIVLNNVEQLNENFNQLSVRLRGLITLAIISISFVLFDLLWFSDLQRDISSIENELMASQTQYQTLITHQQQINSGIVRQKNNPKKIELEKTNSKILAIEDNLSEIVTNLIKPEQMVAILSSIIKSSDGLVLVKFSKLETSLLSQPEMLPTKNNKPAVDQVNLFQHKIEIKLVGSFNKSYQFIQRLEQSENKITFEQFDYQVKEYPKAEITLVVSTLSLQKEWIGG